MTVRERCPNRFTSRQRTCCSSYDRVICLRCRPPRTFKVISLMIMICIDGPKIVEKSRVALDRTPTDSSTGFDGCQPARLEKGF
ncbi:hypothetical protein T10_13524 [Trichinella papuae]|uniref:Uncharacterized protein n=1 Tax=Trichinella papuae TaxID=268474 RepID=A0A0V1MFX0_9BILA|nr:hypothetical protein T10_13524 [Trichinella papuae]